MYKSLVLALAALSSVVIAAPADANTAVTSSSAAAQIECFTIPRWEREERRECKEIKADDHLINRECRDRRAFERPYWCAEYGYRVHDKRAETIDMSQTLTQAQCWEIPEYERRARRECHEENRDERSIRRECADRRARDRPDWCRSYGYRVHDWGY